MPAWRIYYGDGSTYSSDDGAAFCAPARGVQAIVSPDELVGRFCDTQCDYYVWDGAWLGVDHAGLLDYLGRVGFAKYVLQGRTIPGETYRAIMERARTDPGFPEKTARLPKERC